MKHCKFCGREYTPTPGTAPAFDYCRKCSKERREAARKHFEAQPMRWVRTPDGRYMLRVPIGPPPDDA